MKSESGLFKALFREVIHTGSFYDGLRVDDAREFDLNLALDVNVLVTAGGLQAVWKRVDQGFVALEMDKQPSMVIPQNHKLAE